MPTPDTHAATAPTVTELWIYPVKSCRGVPVHTLTLDPLGVEGDRRFLIVTPDGDQVTQRSHPVLARIVPTLDTDHLTLTVAGLGTAQVARTAADAPLRRVTVWSSRDLVAEDCGDDAAAFVTRAVGTSTRLVRIGSAFHRPVKRGSPDDQVGFADGYPLLLTHTASLDDLNARLAARDQPPVPMSRFRPNVVVDGAGAPAFAEDAWTAFRIGSARFRSAGPCGRCIMTTNDPDTGHRASPEPLRTLATFRRDPTSGEVNFGQNLIHLSKTGTLSIGDALTFEA